MTVERDPFKHLGAYTKERVYRIYALFQHKFAKIHKMGTLFGLESESFRTAPTITMVRWPPD